MLKALIGTASLFSVLLVLYLAISPYTIAEKRNSVHVKEIKTALILLAILFFNWIIFSDYGAISKLLFVIAWIAILLWSVIDNKKFPNKGQTSQSSKYDFLNNSLLKHRILNNNIEAEIIYLNGKGHGEQKKSCNKQQGKYKNDFINNLKVWQRAGIVLTILWSVCVVTFAIYQYETTITYNSNTSIFVEWYYKTSGGEIGKERVNFTPYYNYINADSQINADIQKGLVGKRINFIYLFYLVVGVILGAWGLVYLMSGTVNWIRRDKYLTKS